MGDGDGPKTASGQERSTPVRTRADVLKLMRQKDEIEAEVKALYEVLDSVSDFTVEN